MKNQININKNYGTITVANAQGIEIAINTQDANDIVEKLEQLHEAQLDALMQVLDQHQSDLLKLFNTLLSGFASQRNIVKGDISNIDGDVHIGDQTIQQKHSGSGDNVGGDKYEYHFHHQSLTTAPVLPNEHLTLEVGKNVPIELLERQYLLQQFQNLIDNGNQYIVLHGDEGIGKTTFLSIYYNTFSKGNYEQRGWFNFQNTLYETYVAGLTNTQLHEDVKIENWDAFYYQEARLHLKTLRNFRNVANQPTKKIMVIDNVPDEAAILPFFHDLLHLENTVFIFITKTAFSDNRFTNYSLPRLTNEEVKAILSTFFGQKEQTAYANLIKGNAFLLQLVLKQAPRNAAQKVQHYTNRILENLHPTIENRDQQVTEALYRLDQFTPFQEWILIQFAALPNQLYDADTICEYLFPEMLKFDEDTTVAIDDIMGLKSYANFQSTTPKAATFPDDFADAFVQLTQKGWLIEKGEEYELTDLTRAVLAFQEKNQVDYTLELANCLSINFFTLQHGNLKDHLQYRQHLLHYINFIHPVSNPTYLTTLYKLVTWYEDAGKYYEELAYRKSHFDLAKGYYPTNSDMMIRRETDLAWNYKMVGDLEKAKQHGEKALHKAYQLLSKQTPLTAKCEGNLGAVLKDLGDFQEAKLLLEKAMQSDEANFGDKHPNTAVTYSNLALVLQDLGDFQEAKLLLEKAMQSDEANFGDKHPNTARTYSNLAVVLQELGDFQDAKLLLEKAMRSDKANFGDKHPNTALSYSNLALVLKDLGDFQEAKLLLEKAMRSAELNFGDKHPNTALSYSNLAVVLQELGDFQDALPLAFKAYQIYASQLGKEHPNTQIISHFLNSIAGEMMKKGWTKEAIQKLLGLS